MSAADVAVIRDQYEATNEREFERAMGHYAADVVLVPPLEGHHLGIISGREAVGDYFGDWFNTFDRDFHFDLSELTDFGDGRVLAVADHRASGRASGAEVRGTLIWLYRVDAGKIVHLRGFDSREAAIASMAD